MMEPQELLEQALKAQSLDEFCDIYAEHKSHRRDLNWVDGDLVVLAVDRFGATKATYGKLAEIGMGTIKHLQQIERVARAFPSQEERLPDIPWSLYRAAQQAAARTGENPFEVLLYGLDRDWHAKDFARYKRDPKIEFEMRCTCPICGFAFHIKGPYLVSAPLLCPICDSEGEETLLPGEFTRKE